MKFLLIARQERHASAYFDTLKALADRGHQVAVAVQEADGRTRRAEERGLGGIRIVHCPSARVDEWAPAATLARRLRDWVHYLRPAFAESPALQQRFWQRACEVLELDTDSAAVPTGWSPTHTEAIESVLELAERGIPTSPLFDALLSAEEPDVLLVSPLTHLGPSQADLVASARQRGIPVWMLLYSWDNLSTKGSLHLAPDLLFVWNQQQRTEAERLHGFPPSRTVVVGAPRFDAFFELRPDLTAEQFLTPLGLDPRAATILYLCSSPLVSPDEFRFVRRWLQALRLSASSVLRDANVIVRPHPANPFLPPDVEMTRHEWPQAARIEGRVARPFEDRRAVVVETPHEDPRGLFESLTHSNAVVALNTTAELEAGIVGRPVFTMRPDGADDHEHQATLHFFYLTRDRGGFVSAASSLEEHLQSLDRALTAGDDPAAIRSFIESFLRPQGLDRPVVPLLAEALERAAAHLPPAGANSAPPPVAQPGRTADVPLVIRLLDDSDVSVHATPETLNRVTEQGTVRIDYVTVKWLRQYVHAGDVFYDIHADFGPYALLAACQQAARVVAFEPRPREYAALCDNVKLNKCGSAVIPVALALSSRDCLADAKRRRVADGRAEGPGYCWSRLDGVVERYGLPPATHLRLSPNVSADDVLDGAGALLTRSSLHTVWVEVPFDQEAALAHRLAALAFSLERRKERRKTVRLLFARSSESDVMGAVDV